MSLVAYADSDESEDEDPEEPTPPKEEKKIELKSATQNEQKTSGNSLFSSLPTPKQPGLKTDVSSILLNKKGIKESVKITIPSLSEFKDDEDMLPPSKKIKPSSKGSGLFAILPAPKNLSTKETNRPLVPKSVVKSVKVQLKKVEPAPVLDNKNTIGLNYEESDESDHEGESTDFFKLNDNTPMYEYGSVTAVVNRPEPEIVATDTQTEESIREEVPVDHNFIPLSQDNMELDEEAMQKLCGRKRSKMPMKFIDLSGEEIMPDSKEWMVKQLTEEKPLKSHSHRKKDGPSSQEKRKHQITYLAYQAKEQELELQNQWANNRLSKKQTQSKYGF